MMIFLAVGVLLDGFMVSGFLTSRKNRSTDWRCYATYIGFIAAVAAVTGVMINALGFHLRGHESPYAMSPALQAYNLLSGLLIFAALSVTFFTGLLSRGKYRIALVGCTALASLMLLGTVAAHFGD
jgi:hypothetical protein